MITTEEAKNFKTVTMEKLLGSLVIPEHIIERERDRKESEASKMK